MRALAIAILTGAALAGCMRTGALESALTSPQAPTAALHSVPNPPLQIAPPVGAPSEAVTQMSARIAARASEMGIALTSNGPDDGLVMKGYFSAITEGATTTVIYVWDVLDASGNRLHRIQGQERAAATGGEGWASVSAGLMETVADASIDQYAAWLIARQG